MSYSVHICGCCSAEMVRASRSNRAFSSGSEERCDGRTLTATSRPRRVSRARYTSPIPPAPSGESISYGPSLVPEVSPISARNYSLKGSCFVMKGFETQVRNDGKKRPSQVARPSQLLQSVISYDQSDGVAVTAHATCASNRQCERARRSLLSCPY